MEDKLETVFRMQRELNDEIVRLRGLDDWNEEIWLQKLTLAMLSELAELLDGVNFKWWKNPKATDDEYIKEEIIDLAHFLVSMAQRSGMDADEFFKRYIAKHDENLNRQHGKSMKDGYDVSKISL